MTRGLLAALLAVVLALAAGCGGGNDPGGAAPATTAPAAEAGETFENPVYDIDFPDPFVLKVGDTYHAYATNGNGQQVQTLTSPDLVDWTQGGDALPQLGAWAYPGKTWAPEVLALEDGTYVLYYTANGGSQCIGRAVADAPEGPFVDRWKEPLVCQRIEGGSIDASPFRDDDGTLYLLWKNDGNALGMTTWIYVQRLSEDGTELVGKPVRVAENDVGWEGGVVEAPVLWKHDGRYYLFFSGNDFGSDYYAVGYATCEGPLGPCADAPENPILKTACDAAGPGHNAIVEVDGRTWTIYHAWPPTGERTRREVWLDELEWRDGKPVVDGPTCEPQEAP